MQPQDPFQQQRVNPQQPGNPAQPAGRGGYAAQQYPQGRYPQREYGQQQYGQQQYGQEQYGQQFGHEQHSRQQNPGQQYPHRSRPGAAAPGGYQQPGWYQTEPPKRRTGLIVGISAAVVVVAVTALILVLTLGGNSKDTANTTTPTAVGGLPGAPTTGGAPATSPGPVTSGGPLTSAPPATTAAVPAGNALTSRATVERVAQLISSNQANVASVYACAAERQTFLTENTLPAGVTAVITVTNVTENGATAQGSFTVKAQNTATGQTQDGQDTVTLQRNNAGAWIICSSALGANDHSVPNESNAPAAVAVPPASGGQGGGVATTAGRGTPGADQATQVAQSWAAAISAGDVTTAQQYLCSAYSGPPGGASTGHTLTLQGISQTGQDTATAEFTVSGNGQEGTAQVAMKVENSRWTICQQG